MVRDMVYIYSLYLNRYLESFHDMESLLAYLAHFNVDLIDGRAVIEDIAHNIYNRDVVNYFISLRIASLKSKSIRLKESDIFSGNNFDTVIKRINRKELVKTSKRQSKKIAKHCRLEEQGEDLILNDLIILENDKIVYLDDWDIDAVLNRLTAMVKYRSYLDMPSLRYRRGGGYRKRFSYRSHYRQVQMFNTARQYLDPEYSKYNRASRLALVKYWKSYGEFDRGYSKSWKDNTKIDRHWKLHITKGM